MRASVVWNWRFPHSVCAFEMFFVKSPFIVKQGEQLAVKVTARDGWLIWSQVGSSRYGSRTAVLLIAAHYLTTTISEIDFEVVPSLCLMTTFWENLLLATEFYLSVLYLIVYGTLLADYLIRHTCYIFFNETNCSLDISWQNFK